MDSNNFDAIVIGSGMGGLTTSSIIAQLSKKRVLVVERQFQLGGFTHSFRRKKYEWDVGIHHIGDMQPGSTTRGVMDLVTRQGVEWQKMDSPYERFVSPQGTFDVHDDEKRFQADLIERFPHEEKNLHAYFKDLRKAQSWVARWIVSKQYSPWIANAMNYAGKHLPSITTEEYFKRFKDPSLRALLAAQWPDFGSPSMGNAFGFHATAAADFLQGGFYPIGGSKEIGIHAAKAIEDYGGKCLVNHEVKSINVKNGEACGITVVNKWRKMEFTAPLIISDAGSVTTFGKLVPDGYCKKEREQLARLKPGTSANILFLGLNDDPRNHGFDDCNYWLSSRRDHDTQARARDEPSQPFNGALVSFGSLRTPGQVPHTAQIICFRSDEEWEAHTKSKWMRRGAEHEQFKAKTAESMLSYADKKMPGLRGLVDYQELSTPLTVKGFNGHSAGGIYGQACDANRLFRDKWSIATTLKNLYLTGSDVGTPGVNGAMMAGVMTAAKLMGPLGLPRIYWKVHRLGRNPTAKEGTKSRALSRCLE